MISFFHIFMYYKSVHMCLMQDLVYLDCYSILILIQIQIMCVCVKSRIFMLMRCTLIIEKLWSCPWGWRFTTRFRKSFQKCTGLPTYFPLIFNGIHYVFVKLNEPLWNGWNIKARKDLPKLYIPSTLNINYLLWHTQLIVCAVKIMD